MADASGCGARARGENAVIAMSTDADELAGSLHAAFACHISVAKLATISATEVTPKLCLNTSSK
jgi:hypothetical protein